MIDIRTIGLAAGIDLAPIDGSPGLRGPARTRCRLIEQDVVSRGSATPSCWRGSRRVEDDIAAIVSKLGEILKRLH